MFLKNTRVLFRSLSQTITLLLIIFSSYPSLANNLTQKTNKIHSDILNPDSQKTPDLKPLATPISNKYKPYLEIGGIKYFNQASNAGDVVNLFLPLHQKEDALFFTDLRFFNRTSGSLEGNFHLGYRKINHDTNEIFGLYGAFDHKISNKSGAFNQLTLGFEYWKNSWFVGGNIYRPIGKTKKLLSETESYDYSITEFGITKITTINSSYEKTLSGADLELGYAINNSLTTYLGGYYFNAKDTSTITGPKLRLTYDYQKTTGRILGILDGVGAEIGAQHDSRGNTAYLELKLKIGLNDLDNNTNISGFERHMIDLVRRDPDIITADQIKQTRLLEEITTKTREAATFDPISAMILENNELYELNHIPLNDSYYYNFYASSDAAIEKIQLELYRDMETRKKEGKPIDYNSYKATHRHCFDSQGSKTHRRGALTIKDFLSRVIKGDFSSNIKEEARKLIAIIDKTGTLTPDQKNSAGSILTDMIYKGAEDMMQGKPRYKLFSDSAENIPKIQEDSLSWLVERDLNIANMYYIVKNLKKEYDLEISEADFFADSPKYLPLKSSLSTLKHVGIQLADAGKPIISYTDKSIVDELEIHENNPFKQKDSIAYYTRRRVGNIATEIGFDNEKMKQVLNNISPRWDTKINLNIEKYHWLRHNCQHFAAEAIKEYLRHEYPVYTKY